MSNFTQYKIASLKDFTNIPTEKIQDCLDDFAQWIALNKQGPGGNNRIQEFADVVLPGTKIEENFIWIDDGRSGLSEIRVSCEGELIGTLEFKESSIQPEGGVNHGN